MTLSQRQITFFHLSLLIERQKTDKWKNSHNNDIKKLRLTASLSATKSLYSSTRKGNAKVRFEQKTSFRPNYHRKRKLRTSSKSVISRINSYWKLETWLSLSSILLPLYKLCASSQLYKITRKPNHGRDEWKCGQVAAVLIIKRMGLVSSQSDWRGKPGEPGDAFYLFIHFLPTAR